MKKFIFFTKTNWIEPPRLRHQLANLLKGKGHEIYFFEKPENIFLKKSKNVASPVRNLHLFRSSELVHHKLRLIFPLSAMNAYWEKAQIKKITGDILVAKEDIIINFNYDYFFLRDLFQDKKIITIINDDHWSSALMGYQKPLKNMLKKTCQNSDVVLAVSQPLVELLSDFSNPRLLLPWSESAYSMGNLKSKRRSLLYWGYINNRLDFNYVLALSKALYSFMPDYTIDFIGPVDDKIDNLFHELVNQPNVTLSGPRDIHSLHLDGVLAAFMPYLKGPKEHEVTTLPNKAMPMLAHGIPLLFTGLPEMLDAPFAIELGVNEAEDVKTINSLGEHFHTLQPSIREYVNQNTADVRYDQLTSYF